MNFDEHRIKVLSYQPSFVSVSGRTRNVGMRGSDGIVPTVEYFSFDDLEYMNSVSPVLRSGLLEIEDGAREEVYKRLNILPESCIYERDIDDMLLHPTMEGMKRIVAVTDALTMERIRGHMAKHYSVLTQNVIKVVEKRSKEIANGVRKTTIEIEPVAKPANMNAEQIEQMTNQIDAQNNQIAELKAMLQALLANQQPATVKEPVVETPATKVEKKPGRPTTKK